MKSLHQVAHCYFLGVVVALTLSTALQGQTPVTDPLDRWVRQSPQPTTKPLHHIAHLDGQFIIAAEDGILLEGTDGVAWTEYPAELANVSMTPGFTALAYGRGLYVATERHGDVYTSEDRLVWTQQVNELNSMNDVLFDGTAFVAVGNLATIQRSTDGSYWRRASGLTTDKNVLGITEGEGQLVVVGGWQMWGSPPESLIATSPGGEVWTEVESAFEAELRAVHYAGGRYVAVGKEAPATGDGWAAIVTSEDGREWTRVPGEAWARLYDVAYGGGQWVAVGVAGSILRSQDGLTWTVQESGVTEGTLQSVLYQGGRFWVVGSSKEFLDDGGPVLLASEDGVNWQSLTRDVGGDLYGVAYAAPWFYAFTDEELLLRSATGVEWAPVEHGLEGGNYVSWAFAAEGLTLLGASNPAAILRSADDGATWTRTPLQMFPNAIAHDGEQFVLVGTGGQAATSPDGEHWAYHETGVTDELRGLAYADGTFVAVGGNFGPFAEGVVLTSSDGADWQQVALPEAAGSLEAVAFGNDRFLAYPVSSWLESILWRTTAEGAWEKIVPKDEDGFPVQLQPYSLQFFGGRFVVTGYEGRLYSSPDGEVWRKHETGVAESLWDLAHDEHTLVLVGERRLVQTSSLLDEPFLAVGPPSVTQQTLPGTDAAPVQLFVVNQGTADLAFAVSAADGWVSVQPDEGLVASGRQTPLTLSFHSASLSAGTYRTELHFTGNGINMPLAVPVALQIRSSHEDQPFIEVADDALYAATIVSFQAEGQTRLLRNAGAGSLLYHFSGLKPWLAITPESGTLGTGQAEVLNFSFPGSEQLAPGTYETTVLVAGNAVNSPVYLPVELEVVDRVMQHHESATLVYDFYLDTKRREVRHGLFQRYSPDGELLEAGQFEDNQYVGEWTTYTPGSSYPDGIRRKAQEVVYSGEPAGRRVDWGAQFGYVIETASYSYSAQGTPRTEGHVYEVAPAPGAVVQREFHPDGTLGYEVSVVGGDLGRERTWHASGGQASRVDLLETTAFWQAWVHHGLSQTWFEDGTTASTGGYAQGERDGAWVEYHENGLPREERRYNAGTPHGPYRDYYESGVMKEEGWFFEGTLDQKQTAYLDRSSPAVAFEKWWHQGTPVKGIVNEYLEDRLSRTTETEHDEAGRPSARLIHTFNLTPSGESFLGKEEIFAQDPLSLQLVLHGLQREFNWDAVSSVVRLAASIPYVFGRKQGIERLYHPNGRIQSKSDYEAGVLQGTVELFRTDGSRSSRTAYEAGERQGLHETFHENGAVQSQATYRRGTLQGAYRQYDPAGQLVLSGLYCDGARCGTWYSYAGGVRTPIDYGPITRADYSDTDDGFVEIRGVVTDAATGARLPGAVIEGLPNSPAVQANNVGYYQVTVLAEGTPQVTCSAPFYDPVTVAVALQGNQTVTQSFELSRTASEVPVITRMDSQYGRFFLEGLSVRNRITATINWDVGQPKEVRINKNGQIEIVPGPGGSVSREYDMGRDFEAGFATGLNRLELVAENGSGQTSTPSLYAPVILPIPTWSEPLGPFQVNLGDEGQVVYQLGVAYPKEPIEILLSPETLGSTLWSVWGFVPLVGGQNLGLKQTQLLLALEYASSGEGKASLTGQTGLEIAGSTSVGHLTGEGLLQYRSGEGLSWTGVRVAAGLEVSVEKEEGLITIIPALQGAVRLPVIGRAIGWLNDRAKIKGELGSGMELGLELVRVPDGLDFNSVDGTISASAALGLEVEALRGLSVSLRGEGAGSLTYQFPANPGYLKEATFELGGAVGLSAWLFEVSLSGSHKFTYPPGDARALALDSTPQVVLLRPISRDFVTLGFNRVPRRLGLLDAHPGAARQVLMENIYERSEPVLASHAGQTAAAWVVFDPEKPTLQATEIWFAFLPASGEGSAFGPATAVTSNTQGDFAPTIAFDATGRLIAVWEQVKDPAFADESEDAIAAMAAQMEIVTATFDPVGGTWSVPVALTDNGHLDHAPQLRRDPDGDVILFWQSNDDGFLVGDAESPSRLHLARWHADSGIFSPETTVPVDLIDCLGLDLVVQGDATTLVLARDGDGDLGTAADANLFVATATGTDWTEPRALTGDVGVADNHPVLVQDAAGDPQLLWMHGEDLAHMPDLGSGAFGTVREGSGALPFLGFQALRDPAGNLAILWQDQGSEGVDLFLTVLDATAGAWSRDLRLTQDPAREMYPTAAFSEAGRLQVVFNQRPTPDDPNVDLIALEFPLQQDLAIADEDVSVAPAVYASGDEVTIQVRVMNTGEFVVRDYDVTLYLGDPALGAAALATLESGENGLEAGASRVFTFPWTVPDAGAGGRELLFVRVDAQGRIAEGDEGNNTARHAVFRPDLVADSGHVLVRPDGSLEINARFHNEGAVKAEGIYVDFSASGGSVGTVFLPGLHAGRSAEVTWQGWLADLPPAAGDITFTVDPEQLIDELLENNNVAWMAAPPDPDADRDGLPDWFEAPLVVARGGETTLSEVLPGDDDDQDGSTNAEELEAGTDPLIAGSVLGILGVRPVEGSGLEVSWRSTAGRNYRLEYSNDLRVWLPTEPPIVATDETTGATLDLTNLAVSRETVFLRVRLLDP